MRIIYNVFGYKGSGKDTACGILSATYSKTGVKSRHYAFANPVKEIVEEHFGYYMKDPEEQIWGAIMFKEEPILALPITEGAREMFSFLGEHKFWSGRLLLQFIGTEVFRTVDNNYWTNLLLEKVNKHSGHVLISDCRFPNEMEALQKLSQNDTFRLVNIRINRNGCFGDGHASEKGIKDFNQDHIIENNGSVADLEAQLVKIVEAQHETT